VPANAFADIMKIGLLLKKKRSECSNLPFHIEQVQTSDPENHLSLWCASKLTF
jgi:hypothetical protein